MNEWNVVIITDLPTFPFVSKIWLAAVHDYDSLLLLVTADNKRQILKTKYVLTHSFIHTGLIFSQITGMADSQAINISDELLQMTRGP